MKTQVDSPIKLGIWGPSSSTCPRDWLAPSNTCQRKTPVRPAVRKARGSAAQYSGDFPQGTALHLTVFNCWIEILLLLTSWGAWSGYLYF